MSLPRQSPLPIRTTSFRPSSQKVPLSTQESSLPGHALRTRLSVPPLTSATLAASVAADSIALTLPVPPSVNHQYATVNGRRLLSAKGRAFKELVGQQILVALAQSSHRDTLRQILRRANLSLSIHFFFASALRRDTDGGLKIAQDALCEGLGLNDNRVVETHLYKYQDRDNPRMELRLSVARPAPPRSADPTPQQAPLAVLPEYRPDSQQAR